MGWLVKDTTRPIVPRFSVGANYIGGWERTWAGVVGRGKSHPHRDSISRRSSHSKSLYRLSHPGPHAISSCGDKITHSDMIETGRNAGV